MKLALYKLSVPTTVISYATSPVGSGPAVKSRWPLLHCSLPVIGAGAPCCLGRANTVSAVFKCRATLTRCQKPNENCTTGGAWAKIDATPSLSLRTRATISLHSIREWTPSGSRPVRGAVLLAMALPMFLDALKRSPEQPADTGKCVAYDVQHDALTMPAPERSCASDKRPRRSTQTAGTRAPEPRHAERLLGASRPWPPPPKRLVESWFLSDT